MTEKFVKLQYPTENKFLALCDDVERFQNSVQALGICHGLWRFYGGYDTEQDFDRMFEGMNNWRESLRKRVRELDAEYRKTGPGLDKSLLNMI